MFHRSLHRSLHRLPCLPSPRPLSSLPPPSFTPTQRSLLSRRTLKFFSPLPPSFPSSLSAALHCARYAPCHHLTHPTRVYGAFRGSASHEALLDICHGAALAKTGDAERARRKRMKWASVDGFLLVTCERAAGVPPSSPPAERARRVGENEASSSAAVQNVLLSLHSDGILTKWATGDIMCGGEVLALLRAAGAGEGEAVVAGVMMGGGGGRRRRWRRRASSTRCRNGDQ